MGLIADTTVISNYALAERLDLLLEMKDISTTEEVIEELKVGIRRSVLVVNFSELDMEILRMQRDEMNTFLRLTNRFGRGEASCIAIALHRKAAVLTDDFDARRFAQRGGISVSGSIGVLVNSIDEGIISKEQGNVVLHRMILKGFYSPVETLDQLIS
jgi:predicted nucleic acid-binding protein